MPPSSPAQSTPSGTSGPAPIEFNIPAQSLTSALNQFAKTSGLQVSYPAELTNGLSSSPVAGSYQPEAALGLLLGGTGLTYRFTDAATVTLAQDAPISVVPVPAPPLGASADEEKPVKIPEIVVKEVRQRREHDATMYVTEEATTTTRTDTPIRDVPQSIQVITRKVIEEQRAFRLIDATQNIPASPTLEAEDPLVISIILSYEDLVQTRTIFSAMVPEMNLPYSWGRIPITSNGWKC